MKHSSSHMDRWLKHLQRYPTFMALLMLCCGIFTAQHAYTWIYQWAIAVLMVALCLVLICVLKNWKYCLWPAGCLLLYCIGITFASGDLRIGNSFSPLPQTCLVHASVVEVVSSGPDFRIFLMESGRIINNNESLPGHGRLYIQNNRIRLCAGDRIAFRSFLRKPRNRGNPGEFNWEMYCLNNGIQWLGSVRNPDSIIVLKRGSRLSPQAILFELRRRMAEFLDEHTDGNTRSVLKGIVLGDRGELDYDLRTVFSKSGLAHLLSASGLHVGIIALFVTGVVYLVTAPLPNIFLRIPRRKLAAIASIPAMLVYCFLVGGRIPAVRATILGMVFAIAILTDRRWHSVNSLALTAMMILLLFPLSIYTVSFHLSFAAVFGILLTVPYWMIRLKNGISHIMERRIKTTTSIPAHWVQTQLTGGIRSLVALNFTTLAATLAVSPFLLKWFHFFPVYSLLANLTAGLLLTIALPVALFSAGIGALYPTLGKILLIPAECLVDIMIYIAKLFSNLPGSDISFPPIGNPEFYTAIILVFVLLWILGKPSRRRKVSIFIVTVALISCLFLIPWLRSNNHTLKVVFLNVGKGDACYIKSPGHKGLLIDAGLRSLNFDSGQSIVLPYLIYEGIHSLDGMMISHPQMDHMGGMESVMNKIPTKILWWNPVQIQSAFLTQLFDRAQSGGTSILKAERKCSRVRFGNIILTFLNKAKGLNQSETCSKDLNNSSVVCRLDYGNASFLFTGDIETAAEQELLSSGLLRGATVLKVPHHGCKNGSSLPFLHAVKPRIAVISSGDSKLGKCPDRVVLQRLESVADHVYWTGRDGAVVIVTDGKALHVHSARAKSATIQCAATNEPDGNLPK